MPCTKRPPLHADEEDGEEEELAEEVNDEEDAVMTDASIEGEPQGRDNRQSPPANA
jgi:hypothetical protein